MESSLQTKCCCASSAVDSTRGPPVASVAVSAESTAAHASALEEALTPRMREVLLAVVGEYIETARPVASRSAAARSELEVSSATVRAAMADLARLELLSQPHTSAGRVPTEAAFRLYVQHLISHAESLQAVDPALDESGGDVEALLRGAANALSHATGQLGFFVGRAAEQLVIARIRFVRVASEAVMAVLISTGGVVQTRVFAERSCELRMLETASERLSELVHGLTLREARARLSAAIEIDLERSDALWRRVFLLGRASLEGRAETEVFLGDSQVLLDQPEFEDIARLRQVHAALAEKERLLHLLERTLEADVIGVAMGDELSALGIERCAVVSAGLEGAAGGLGVIGPLRMRYDRVIPAVREVSRRVSDYFG